MVKEMTAKLSENTELQVPLRNLISLVICASLATWAYFGILERLSNSEHQIQMMQVDQRLNTEFRIRWPRGELGSLPADSEQFMLIEHLSGEVEKIQNIIEQGTAPIDKQQMLTLEFFERRVATLETELNKLKEQTMVINAKQNGNH